MGSGDESAAAEDAVATAAAAVAEVVVDSASGASGGGGGSLGGEEEEDVVGMYFRHGALDGIPSLSTVASAMLFASIIFATVGMATRTWLVGREWNFGGGGTTGKRSKSWNISSYDSIFALLWNFSIFGLILFGAYLCENHPPFPHSTKSYDRDEFCFLILALFLASFPTFRRNNTEHPSSTTTKNNTTSTNNKPSSKSNNKKNKMSSLSSLEEEGDASSYSVSSSQSHHQGGGGGGRMMMMVKAVSPACDVLNRDQTEEWKGWMQVIFLLYHYFHAEEVYNSIRVMITCYVWMTGFGNFSFFYLKQDYSIIRVLQMVWRLNFLVIFLCMTQGTTYILYYICPLHTYFFFLVYFTMKTAKHLNYTKYGLRMKLGVVAIGIFLVWDINVLGLFRLLHFWMLGTEPKLGATFGTLWEWYFRSSLDHWSTFLGMLFALNYPMTSYFYRTLESHPSARSCWMGKALVGMALGIVFVVWVTGPFAAVNKHDYNRTHAYFGFIPLLTYIYVRNLTPKLRSYSMELLQDIGKTTLETYLMQHHIWLTSNAKSLLTILPGWPKLNFLLCTFLYFKVSRKLYHLTMYLRGMLLPDDSARKCITNMMIMIAFIGMYYIIAIILDVTGHLSMFAMAVVSFVGGYLLYQTIMDLTWHTSSDTYTSSENTSLNSNSNSNNTGTHLFSNNAAMNRGLDRGSTVSKVSPPVMGALVVLILGSVWQGMAMAGAGPIQPLHAGCDAFVNDGHWVPVNACNEESRGYALRNDGITGLATCSKSGSSSNHVWGWKPQPSFTHCVFSHRSSSQLVQTLKGRSLVFIGDSITRNLFHATCRNLGLHHAGAFDTTQPKHANIHVKLENYDITLDFEWAPLSKDQLEILKEKNEKAAAAAAVVVVPPRSGNKKKKKEKENNNNKKADLIVLGGGTWDRLHVYATDEDQNSHRSTVQQLVKEMRMSNDIGSPIAWLIPTTINTRALNTVEKRDHMKESDMEAMRTVYASLGVLSTSKLVIDGPAFTKDRVEEAYDGVHYPLQVYDAGSQILANALDWLLLTPPTPPPTLDNDDSPEETTTTTTTKQPPPSPGSMAQPFLGVMMLCLTLISLVFFDGFLGFFYTASLYVKGVMPSQLYEQAYRELHQQHQLPPLSYSSSSSSSSSSSFNAGLSMTSSWTTTTTNTKSKQQQQQQHRGGTIQQRKKKTSSGSSTMSLDDELASLLQPNNNDKTDPI